MFLYQSLQDVEGDPEWSPLQRRGPGGMGLKLFCMRSTDLLNQNSLLIAHGIDYFSSLFFTGFVQLTCFILCRFIGFTALLADG